MADKLCIGTASAIRSNSHYDFEPVELQIFNMVKFHFVMKTAIIKKITALRLTYFLRYIVKCYSAYLIFRARFYEWITSADCIDVLK